MELIWKLLKRVTKGFFIQLRLTNTGVFHISIDRAL